MIDGILIGVLVTIVAAAAFYVYRAKKKGQKCIGCPESCHCCSKGGHGDCSCGSQCHK